MSVESSENYEAEDYEEEQAEYNQKEPIELNEEELQEYNEKDPLETNESHEQAEYDSEESEEFEEGTSEDEWSDIVEESEGSAGGTSCQISEIEPAFPTLIAEDVLSETMQNLCKETYESLSVIEDKMGSKLIGKALRRIGFTPTETEVEQYIQFSDPFQNGVIEYSQFLYLVALQSLKPLVTKDDFYQAIQKLATKSEDEIIDTSQLFNDLLSGGEPLTVSDASRLMSVADPKKIGQIDYSTFVENVEILFGKKKKKGKGKKGKAKGKSGKKKK